MSRILTALALAGILSTIGFGAVIPGDQYLPEQVWVEKGGIVVIEAENVDHHEHWVLKTDPEGFTGTGYLEWQGPSRTRTEDGRGGNNDLTGERQGPREEWLILRVLVSEPGVYVVDARNLHQKEDGDNDAWVWQLNRPITEDDPVRRMGDSHKDGTEFTWLDWGHRKFNLRKGENHLYIGGRSVGFGIDRIAIFKDGDELASEVAHNLETAESQLAEDHVVSQTYLPFNGGECFLPAQVWKESGGIVLAEAEAIDHHPHWNLKTEPEGFTGEGYLEWNGPDRMRKPQGDFGNDDLDGLRQGPQDEWLIFRVHITQPGSYRFNARNHHVERDGDNDAWFSVIGREITEENPVKRIGDSLRDGEGVISWLDWGTHVVELDEGIHNLYVGGRSPGFGIDRLALYLTDDEGIEEKALNPETPVSELAEE